MILQRCLFCHAKYQLQRHNCTSFSFSPIRFLLLLLVGFAFTLQCHMKRHCYPSCINYTALHYVIWDCIGGTAHIFDFASNHLPAFHCHDTNAMGGHFFFALHSLHDCRLILRRWYILNVTNLNTRRRHKSKIIKTIFSRWTKNWNHKKMQMQIQPIHAEHREIKCE